MTENAPQSAISSTLDYNELPDVIQKWVEYTSHFPTTAQFNLWACLSCIGGALQRRCWIVTAGRAMFPNTFIMLISPPGVGKTDAIQTARDVWSEFMNLPVAPQSMTGKGLIDQLAADQSQQTVYIDGEPVCFHSLLIPAAELGTLIQEYDITQISILNDLFDCNTKYEERTRGGGILSIERPHLNLLMGTQPKFLGHVFPEAAFGMGLTSRIIMVYDDKAQSLDLFNTSHQQDEYDELVKLFKPIANMRGQFDVSDDAKDLLQQQHSAGFPPAPDSFKLIHYNSRRTAHVLKLCMIVGAARHGLPYIEYKDVVNAIELLHDVEKRMPEVFNEMSGGSETEVIYEAHYTLIRMYNSNQKKPLPESNLHSFLQQRVAAWKVSYIVKAMYQSGAIKSAGNGMIVPGRI